MAKYKVGDKVLVEGEIKRIDYCEHPYEVLIADMERIRFSEDELRCATNTYEDGLNDAWELARKLKLNQCDGGLSNDTIAKAFCCTTYDILKLYTPQEALKILEAYEESKAINVGDVVECFSDYKGVVLDCDDELGTLDVFSENGCVGGLAFSDVKKTGRHIDISNLLEQIRGDD